MTPVPATRKRRKFDLKTFLSTIDGGRRIGTFTRKQTIFGQGDSADSFFCLQRGKVKLTAISASGKEGPIGFSIWELSLGRDASQDSPSGCVSQSLSLRFTVHC
jgi:CRP-like cAMP-binding protein